MEVSPAVEPTDAATSRERCLAAIETLEGLMINGRTLRRGSFPPGTKRRIGEIVRLSEETLLLLRNQLAAVEAEIGRERALRHQP